MTDSEMLKKEQETTLASKKLKPGISAKILFTLMDIVYGKKATLSKFLVLEIVARMPYVAWEQVSYVAITHTHSNPEFARNIHDTVVESREQQDNETWHLLIIEELLQKQGKKQGLILVRIIPQFLAWIYYRISWLMFVIKPKWSYTLNAQFEDHAEHEYMNYVKNNPQLDEQKWESAFMDDYGQYDTLGDLFRRIGLDEREHKEASLERIEKSRFAPISE